MARDSGGDYTLPAGNPVVSGSTIDSTVHNDTMSDLGTEIQDSLSRSGKGGMTAVLKGVAGSAAAPAFSFTDDPDTGIYRIGANNLGIATLGVQRVDISASRIEVSLPLRHADGTAAAPAMSFSGDNDTGIYRIGANNLGIAVGGAKEVDINATRVLLTRPLYAADGAVGAPSVTFGTDTDTGLYSIGANSLGVAVGGVLKATFASAAITLNDEVRLNDGSESVPILTFNSDQDTGLYLAATGQLAVTLGGSTRVTFNNNGFDVTTASGVTPLVDIIAVGATDHPGIGLRGTAAGGARLLWNETSTDIRLYHTDAAGALGNLAFVSEAGGALSGYHNGVLAFNTATHGLQARGTLTGDPTLSGAQDAEYRLENGSGTTVARFGYFTSTTTLGIRNDVYAGHTLFNGRDVAGTLNSELELDPDGPVTASHAGDEKFRSATDANGALQIDQGDGWQRVLSTHDLKYKTADESVTSSTAWQDDDHLVFTVAIGFYEFEAILRATSTSATPGISIRTNLADGAVVDTTNSRYWLDGDADAEGDYAIGTGHSNQSIGAGDVTFLRMKGIVEFTTGGTLKIQWAQGVSDAAATTLLQGSWMKLRRIDT